MAIGVGLARVGQLQRANPIWSRFDAYIPEVDLPVDDMRFPYLRLIDPYDETVITAYQCAVMLGDFERLAEGDPNPDNLAVLDLIRRCAGDPAFEIWFLGD